MHFKIECCRRVTDSAGQSTLFSMLLLLLRGASMKRVRAQLLATATVVALGSAAYAADMGVPMKAPVPAPIPYTGWQGWYLGGSIGAARLNVTANQTIGDPSAPCSRDSNGSTDLSLFSCSTGTTGFTAGVQAGYDWQSRYFVYGVVADWTWTNLKHTVTNSAVSVPFFQAKVDWLASFRGRMGLAVDDTLVYLTGGVALGELKSSAGVLFQCPDECFNSALSKTQVGWVAGAGVEHKLNQNWSVFGEFLYYDLGRATAQSTTPSGIPFAYEFTHEIFQGKLGVNYRF
jgi:outer membrane immunogenic protein